MNTLENIQKISFLLKDALDDSIANDCINYLKSRIVYDFINKGVHPDEYIDILRDLSSYQYTYESDDIFDLIFQLSGISRERSHGAVYLEKAYINKHNFEKLKSILELQKESKIFIGKAEILYSDDITRELGVDVFGLCRPKFSCVSYDSMIVLGKLRRNNDKSSVHN